MIIPNRPNLFVMNSTSVSADTFPKYDDDDSRREYF